MRTLRNIVSVLVVLVSAALLGASCAAPDETASAGGGTQVGAAADETASAGSGTQVGAAAGDPDSTLSRPRPRCGRPGLYASCRENLGREACVAQHGRWGRWGLAPAPSCMCPSDDAGCPCQRASDCQGACVAPSGVDCHTARQGTCSEERTVFGCYCQFGVDGQPETICVD